MGAINFKTSKYITLGYKPYYIEEDEEKELLEMYIEDREDIKDISEISEYEKYNIINDVYNSYYESDYENLKYILEKYKPHYFHFEILDGYYESLQLNIEYNYDLYFGDYHEKQDALKELKDIKKMMIEMADVGLVACYPSWCTGYKDYKGTLKAINEAIKEMREEIKHTPTYLWYCQNRYC